MLPRGRPECWPKLAVSVTGVVIQAAGCVLQGRPECWPKSVASVTGRGHAVLPRGHPESWD